MTFNFKRGTKTERIKTARLRPGDQVLTAGVGHWNYHDDRAAIAFRKTDAITRTVERTERHQSKDRSARQTKYRVYFTDGTLVEELSPIQTWFVVAKEV